MRIIQLYIFGLTAGLCFGALASADDCDALLVGGVFNTKTFESNSNAHLALRDFVLQSSFSEVDKARKAGLSVDAIIKSIPIGVSGDFNESNFERWKKLSLSNYQVTTSSATSIRFITKEASPEILKAWVECKRVSTGRSGLNARLIPVGNAGAIFSISWIPTPGDSSLPIVKSLIVTGGDVNKGSELKSGDEILIGIDSNLVTITRTVDVPLIVLLKTSKGDISASLESKDLACTECKGATKIVCGVCQGLGRTHPPDAPLYAFKPCTTCRRSGFLTCIRCKGTGKEPKHQ